MRVSETGARVPRVWANRLTRSSSSIQRTSITSGSLRRGGGGGGAGRPGGRARRAAAHPGALQPPAALDHVRIVAAGGGQVGDGLPVGLLEPLRDRHVGGVAGRVLR